MKIQRQILSVSLLAILPACAHQRLKEPEVARIIPVQIPGTKVPASQYETLRNGEVIKQYYAGAYVDPNNPNIRHNPHDIQRLEQAATWNLRPNVPVVAGGPAYVASSSAAQNSALSAQLSGQLDRQKGYTDALTQQNEKLQQVIQQLNATKEQDAQAKAAAEAELKLTVQTLKSLKEELQKSSPQQAPTPAPSITPKKDSLFDNLIRGNETGQVITPREPRQSPRMQALIETLDLHIAALDPATERETPTNPQDSIDLDAIANPLTRVAQTKAARTK